MEQYKQEFKQYLQIRLNPSTVKQYVSYFHTFNVNPSECTQQTIDSFLISKVYKVSSKANNPFYKGFLKHYITCFKLPFIVTKNERKISKEESKLKFIEKDELDSIINASSSHIAGMTRLYFETGLRLRELIEITPQNIDFDEMTLKGLGKGNKPFTVHFSEQSGAFLRDRIIRADVEGKPLYFGGEVKNQGHKYYYQLRKVGRSVGVEVTPHRIRHTLGRFLRVQKGWDLEQLRVKLRHSKLETTKIYSIATVEEVHKKEMEDLF